MAIQGKGSLRIFPALTLAVFLLPVLAGSIFTWLPAFGYLPAIGADRFGLQPLSDLLSHPSFPGSLRATLVSGLGAALLALALALWITITIHGSNFWRLIERSLAPLLALPHAAFAIGFVFLVSPSGWVLRLLSPHPSGFAHPPDWIVVGDPLGLSLAVTMALKEIPFLLLMIFSGLSRLDVRRISSIGHSLGYGRTRIWSRLILPQLYPMIRLPFLAVLAYSLSVVDLALIAGPSLPPTLAVLIDRWFNDPGMSLRLTGAAGALVLLLVTSCCICAALLAEGAVRTYSKERIVDGNRTSPLDHFRLSGGVLAWFVLATSLLCIVILVIWSIATTWRFPDFLPAGISPKYWLKTLPLVRDPMVISLLAGLCSSAIALVLVIGCLEHEHSLERSKLADLARRSLWIVYIPLLVPQIGFFFGIQVLLIWLHLEGSWFSLVWSHLIFVLPYTFLTLVNSYRTFDKRITQVATLLCGSPWRSFLYIKLPILARPILFSLGVGFAVSIAQYLPTLYVGAGRFATITTETVNLASGSDRRVIGVYALCQFLLPLLAYLAAILLPAVLYRNRKAMQS